MTIHLKRTIFFFCILYLGLGCCLDIRANAQYQTGLAAMLYEHAVRYISGKVTFNGIGLEKGIDI